MKTLKKFAAFIRHPFGFGYSHPADTNTSELTPAKLNPGKKRSAKRRRR